MARLSPEDAARFRALLEQEGAASPLFALLVELHQGHFGQMESAGDRQWSGAAAILRTLAYALGDMENRVRVLEGGAGRRSVGAEIALELERRIAAAAAPPLALLPEGVTELGAAALHQVDGKGGAPGAGGELELAAQQAEMALLELETTSAMSQAARIAAVIEGVVSGDTTLPPRVVATMLIAELSPERLEQATKAIEDSARAWTQGVHASERWALSLERMRPRAPAVNRPRIVEAFAKLEPDARIDVLHVLERLIPQIG